MVALNEKKRSYAWLGWVTAIVVGVVVAFAVANRQHRTTATITGAAAPAPVVKPAQTTVNIVEESGALKRAATPPPPSLFQQGLADLLAGSEPKARREFIAAVAANPKDKKARFGLAIANRNWEDAKQLARELQAAKPDDPDVQKLRRFLREVEVQQQQRGRRPRRLRPVVH